MVETQPTPSPTGTHCVETADIMKFVGERVGMAPPAEKAQNDRDEAQYATLLAELPADDATGGGAARV